MIGGTSVVVLGLAQVGPVVRLAETGNLKGGAGKLCPLRYSVVDLGPLDVPGPEGQKMRKYFFSAVIFFFIVFLDVDVAKKQKKNHTEALKCSFSLCLTSRSSSPRRLK